MSQAQVSWSVTAHVDGIGVNTLTYSIVWANGPAVLVANTGASPETGLASRQATNQSTFWSPHFSTEDTIKAVQLAAAAVLRADATVPLNFPPDEIVVLGV